MIFSASIPAILIIDAVNCGLIFPIFSGIKFPRLATAAAMRADHTIPGTFVLILVINQLIYYK